MNCFPASVFRHGKRLLGMLLVCLSGIYGSAYAQVLLQDHLSALEKKYKVIFSYDSDLLKGIKISDTSTQNLAQALSKLNDQTAFEFMRSSSSVLVKPRMKGANLKVCGT